MNTNVIHDMHSNVLLLNVISIILFYSLLKNIISIFQSVASPVTPYVIEPLLKNMMSKTFFIFLKLQKNSSSVSLDISQNI